MVIHITKPMNTCNHVQLSSRLTKLYSELLRPFHTLCIVGVNAAVSRLSYARYVYCCTQPACAKKRVSRAAAFHARRFGSHQPNLHNHKSRDPGSYSILFVILLALIWYLIHLPRRGGCWVIGKMGRNSLELKVWLKVLKISNFPKLQKMPLETDYYFQKMYHM